MGCDDNVGTYEEGLWVKNALSYKEKDKAKNDDKPVKELDLTLAKFVMRQD